jgi:mannose-6-phosphate isomerase-like protein (cupin superfamily)
MKRPLKMALCLVALAACSAIVSAQDTVAADASKAFDFLGLRATILLSGAETGDASALIDVYIPASVGPGAHIHTREDEVYLIKSGTFQFFMDGICLQAGPGATLYLPKRHVHAFKNITQSSGELLLFVYPAGLDRYFREIHDLQLTMPQDRNKLFELSENKYGITYFPGHDFHAGVCRVVEAINTSTK